MTNDKKWEDFSDQKAIEEIVRKPRRKKQDIPQTRRERGEVISPESTQRAVERNKLNNPVKVVHGLRMSNLLTAARCSNKFCPTNDYQNCDFRASEKLPAAQRHCPIPQWIYNEERKRLEAVAYNGKSPDECNNIFEDYIHESAYTRAQIEWGRCMQATFGGFSAVISANDNTPLGNINRTLKSLVNKLLRANDKLGCNPQDLAKLKKDLYETESIVDQLMRRRQESVESGASIPEIGEPEWGNDITDAEFTEIENSETPKQIEAGTNTEVFNGNPFTGEAATIYDKLNIKKS